MPCAMLVLGRSSNPSGMNATLRTATLVTQRLSRSSGGADSSQASSTAVARLAQAQGKMGAGGDRRGRQQAKVVRYTLADPA